MPEQPPVTTAVFITVSFPGINSHPRSIEYFDDWTLMPAARCAQTQRATAAIHQMLAQCVVIEVAPCRSRRPRHPAEHDRALHLACRPRIAITPHPNLPLPH